MTTKVPEVDPRIAAEEAREANRAAVREDQAAGLTSEMRLALDYESAPAWTPDVEGSIITGTVVAILKASIENDFGYQEYPKVIVKTATGNLYAIHALGTVIFHAFKRLRTKVGDSLVLKYNGTRIPKSGGQAYRDITILDNETAASLINGGNWSWDTDAAQDRRKSRANRDDPGY